MSAVPNARTLPEPRAARAAWLPVGHLRQRLHERSFWLVQLGIVAVMAVHGVAEGLGIGEGGAAGALLDVSVVLYLVPVVYGGLVYGFEGGVLTAAWASVLAAPNLLAFHGEGYEWVGELLVLAFVVALGALIAVPVEQERQVRARAEEASRRLALLNDNGAVLMQPTGLDTRLQRVADELVDQVGLCAVAIVTDEGTDDPTVRASCGDPSGWAAEIARALDTAELAPLAWTEISDTAVFPIALTDGSHDYLLARAHADQPLRPGDVEVLRATAAQLALTLENTRLHRLERDRLRSYVIGITRAQERERGRIARDLHDVATHELLLACRDVDALLETPGSDGNQRLNRLRDRTADVVDYLRRFTRDLRPGTLDHLGIVPALEWLTNEVSQRTGLSIDFHVHGAPDRFEREAEISLYRIVEEALRNVDRHARATHAEVTVSFSDRTVRVQVDDDGDGLTMADPTELVRNGHLGLLGMQERANLVGGAIAFGASPTGGGRVSVTCPLTSVAPGGGDG
jgi:signal transduction histidine kinase